MTSLIPEIDSVLLLVVTIMMTIVRKRKINTNGWTIGDNNSNSDNDDNDDNVST